MAKTITHEAYIAAIWALIRKRKALSRNDRYYLDKARLSYGVNYGHGVRGVSWHEGWNHNCGGKPRIGTMICLHANGQESMCQLAGTVLHEAAHVLAGPDAGHNPTWKAACERVGLPGAVNGGVYTWAEFDPELAKAIQRLPEPNDGRPILPQRVKDAIDSGKAAKPCGAGHGTRGGTSRGKGSGSRQMKHTCGCTPPLIIRCSREDSRATCKVCGKDYKLDETSVPQSRGMGQSGQGVPAHVARAHGARKPKAKRKRVSRVNAKRHAQAPLPQRTLGDNGGPHDVP